MMEKSEKGNPHPGLPIGVFDSGIGGLTVVKALRQRLPGEGIIYFGDTARVPYGIKSPQTIVSYARQITDFLLGRGVKLLIVACNTMAAVARQEIQARASVPVLDVIEAGADAAVGATRNRQIGVIGTPATIMSSAYTRALQARDSRLTIHTRACPLFVPLVEEGWFDHEVTRLAAREYLAPLLAAGIDTLVLGCTHYPLLKGLLGELAGPDITLVDSAEAMAAITENLLKERGLAASGTGGPELRCFVTDVPYRFQEIAEMILGCSLGAVELVKW